MADESSFIRQIQIIGGAPVVSDISISSDSGQVMSKPVHADASVFQLYTNWRRDSETTELLKLDEKAVGTFFPEVVIETSSEDPHVPTTTRSDQPYEVRVTVAGLREEGTVPEYARTVLVGRGYDMYSLGSFTPTGETGYYEDSWVAQTNGEFVDSAVMQRLPGSSLTRVAGAETYSVFTRPETGSSFQLATAEVIVWPVAVAAFEGIEEGKTYSDLPAQSRVILRDAYPRSTTYARIHKGRPEPGAEGTVISSTMTRFGSGGDESVVPQDATIPIGSLSDYITTEGEYTIEVMTVTPFNKGTPERLTAVSFLIDRTVEVRSALYSLD